MAANEQVYVSYGDKTNSELALDYGFVDAQDLAGSYLLTLSIPPDDPFFDYKVRASPPVQRSSLLRIHHCTASAEPRS